MVPQLSAPLTKLIRTGEGILLFGFNISATVLAVVGDVAPSAAVKYAAIFNAVAFASRQALKAVASLKPLVGAPLPVQIAGHSEADILAQIDAVAAAAESFRAKPGTPVTSIVAGLAPDSETPPASA